MSLTESLTLTTIQVVQVSVSVDTQEAVDDVRAYRRVDLSGVHLAEPVADELFC